MQLILCFFHVEVVFSVLRHWKSNGFDRKWKDPVADSFRSQVCRFPTDGQQPQGEIFPRGRWSESISINDPMFLFLISRTSHYCWRTKPKPFLTSTGCWHAPSCLLWTAAALLNLSGEPLDNVVDSGIFKHDHQIWGARILSALKSINKNQSSFQPQQCSKALLSDDSFGVQKTCWLMLIDDSFGDYTSLYPWGII